MQSAIELKNVTKKYKEFSINELSLSIPKGLATVFIGNNGAGKTTLLKIMSQLITCEGEVFHDGGMVKEDDDSFKESMVYVPDSCCFPSFMDIKKVCELMKLGFHAFDESKFIKLCNEFELIQGNKLQSKKIKEMSTGNQMKLMLCAMLARKGKYLLLDEPAANLDPVMQDLLQEKMRAYLMDEEHTIIYSTHNIEQVNNVADYVVFMKDGCILEQGLIDDVCDRYFIVQGNKQDQDRLKKGYLHMRVHGEYVEGLMYKEETQGLSKEMDITIMKPDLRELSIFLLKKEPLCSQE